jgi:hypothetical protein
VKKTSFFDAQVLGGREAAMREADSRFVQEKELDYCLQILTLISKPNEHLNSWSSQRQSWPRTRTKTTAPQFARNIHLRDDFLPRIARNSRMGKPVAFYLCHPEIRGCISLVAASQIT